MNVANITFKEIKQTNDKNIINCVALYHPNPHMRKIALKKCTDKIVLSKSACEDPIIWVRKKASAILNNMLKV